MHDSFKWSVAFPGIDLVDDEDVKHRFIKFVWEKYQQELTENPQKTIIQEYGSYYIQETNKYELYREIKRTCDYIELQDNIVDVFFERHKKQMIQLISSRIRGFSLINEQEQGQFIKALIAEFDQTLPSQNASLSYESFCAYMDKIDSEWIEKFVKYKSLQDHIEQEFRNLEQKFFNLNKKDLIVQFSKIIPGFFFVSEEKQSAFILDLIPLFIQDCIKCNKEEEMDQALFFKYVRYLLKSQLLSEPYHSERNRLDEKYKELRALIEKNMLEALHQAFDFLFLLPCEDKAFSELFFVFDLTLNAVEKIERLTHYFNEIHKQGKVLIENGYQENITQDTQNFVLWGLESLLAIPGVREIGSSVALLTRGGFLHEGNGGVVAEVGNAILVADNAHTAGHIRKLLHTLYLPLQPLAQEWFVILPSETSWIMIGLRFLVPILIASVIIALGFLLISSIVSMPAIFELLMIIPLIYFGFVVASSLISLRDYAYESIKSWVYGGKYNTPEYQINPTLISAFGKETASMIRDYYVEEFEKCDRQIEYSNRINSLSLTGEIRKHIEENGSPRKKILLEEWARLTASRKIDNPDVNFLHNLIKKRVKLDSTNQVDSNQSYRNEYLKKFCDILKEDNPQCAIHGFFQDRCVNELNGTLYKSARKKLERLNEIHTNTTNTTFSMR